MDPAASPAPEPAGVPEVPRQAHSLTLSSGAVFGASLAVQLIGLVGSVFLAKTIGLSTAGQALLGTAQLFLLIGSSINGLADLRLGTAYTYFLARGKPPRDNTSTYLLVGMAMDAAAVAVLFVIAPLVLGPALVYGTSEWLDLSLFLALPILWSFSGLYNSMYIGLGNSLKAQYPSLVEALVRLPILGYVAYAFHYQHHNLGIEGIGLAYVSGAIASTLFSLPALLPQLARFRWSEATAMFRFSWPLMGSLFINYVVTNLTPFIVVSIGAAQLSIFLAANGWRILVLSVPAAVTTPLFPYLAGLHKKREFEALRKGTWQALRYSAMLLVPGVVALVTYRYNFLNVFQNALYARPGALPLAILVIGALPLALSQIIQSSINAIGRQRLELYITSTQVVVLVVAVGILLPSNGVFPIFYRIYPASLDPGLIAASFAILLSSFAALGLNAYFMETLIRVHIRPRPIASIILSAAGSFASLYVLNRYHLFAVSSWYQLLSAVVIGFVVYFVILALIGELSREDVRRIGGSVGLPAWLYEPIGRICWRASWPDLPPIDLSQARGFESPELPEAFTGMRELPDIAEVSGEGELGPEGPPRP
ncbi:MAG TPA: oligosaccharide flippase family protein [Thermoplasmata archaeon]|nr:oligosaccharide flippase family protein [Thermoplasmata archaeon]